MEIEAVKSRKDGFYTQPLVFGGRRTKRLTQTVCSGSGANRFYVVMRVLLG